jgi:hypothetical protein
MSPLVRDRTIKREAPRKTIWASRLLDRFLVFCGLVAAVLIVTDADAPAFAAFKLVIWLILPGWAVIRQVPVADPAVRWIWTVVTSVVIATILGLLMAWTGSWHPQPVAAVTLVASSARVFLSPRHAASHSAPVRKRLDNLPQWSFSGFSPWVILGAANLLWIVALTNTDTTSLDELGLLSKFPPIWYAALGLVLALCIWGVSTRRVSPPRMMGASVTGLVIMLYASASLLTSVPRLPWTYKHIAVTDLISAVGRVDPSIDIYNRWPGFFSASAFLGDVVGYRDALAYASWAEVGFALADVFLVAAITRAISNNPRIYWTAAIVFALANWVGQNYYSPQAFAFTLYLTMCLLALSFLRGTPVKLVRAIEHWTPLRPRRPADPSGAVSGRALRIAATIMVLVLQGVVVASHQLSPYLAVIGLLPLFALGFFRPRWVGPTLLAIAVLYLVPNLDYIIQTFGLFDGYDVLANATSRPADAVPHTEAERWQEVGVMALSASTGILAVAGYVRRLIMGEVRTTLLVGWLAAAPLFMLLGQSYGGEVLLRVYLFALPWLAIGVGWLFWSGTVATRRAAIGLAFSLAVMAMLFTATYFQPELDHRVPEGDVVAAKWLDETVTSDDLVLEVNSGFPRFPLAIGSNYPLYVRPGGTASLVGLLEYSPNAFSAADVENYIATNFPSAANTYVIFSESQERYAAKQDRLDPAVLPNSERQIAADSNVKKVIDNGSVRIYRLMRASVATSLPDR